MAEYTVEKISQQPPRVWEGPNGTIYYIKTKLAGVDKAVSIGKKSPDALKAGDTVSGTITPDPSHDEDKFKADPKPFTGGGGGSRPSNAPRGTTPEDKESIARAVALKASVDFWSSDKPKKSIVLATADSFLAWLKGSEVPQSDEPRYENTEGF